MLDTALDAPFDKLDESEQSFVSKIREYGWYRTGIFADDDGPGYSFTTGLWITAGQPEIVMFSIKDAIAHDVFWNVFRDANEGKTLESGKPLLGLFGNAAAYAFPVAKKHYAAYLGWSCWFYGGENFPCLQVVWPDREGLFPWDMGFDSNFADDQTDLSENGWVKELEA